MDFSSHLRLFSAKRQTGITIRHILLSGLVTASLACVSTGCAQPSLIVTYGSQGIERLSYRGVGLEDLSQTPSDAFHIWHMQATDLKGKALTMGQYGWGEVNNGRTWNAATHTWTYAFIWGSIQVCFTQIGDTLDMSITTNNAADSGIVFGGATIYPFVLHFAQRPVGFSDANTPELSLNLTAPGIVLADYGQGEVAAVATNARQVFYSGFTPSSAANGYTPVVSTTTPDGTAAFLPRSSRSLLPGQSETIKVSLRFGAPNTPLSTLAADIYKGWAAVWPFRLNWTDRRIIGSVYLATSPQDDRFGSGADANNPRHYFDNSNAPHFNVNTPAGLALFQAKTLQQAVNNVKTLKRLNAQGVITWDIEGEQFPQPTSYACSPDQIAQLAPEMETVVTAQTSPYLGMKLDDAYFKTMRDAGYKIGVCVRPQHLSVSSAGGARQIYLSNAAAETELLAKMRFAHDRWGATLFYVDSSVEADGAVLSPEMFNHLEAALPDSLIIPEESTPKDYAYAAPLKTFLFHSDLGTDPNIYDYYPHAFSVNLVNDVDSAKLARYTQRLVESVERGDILVVHADYWQANNPIVLQIYQAAASSK